MVYNIQNNSNTYTNLPYNSQSQVVRPYSSIIALPKPTQNTADSGVLGLSGKQQTKKKSLLEKNLSKLLIGAGLAIGAVLIFGKFRSIFSQKIKKAIDKMVHKGGGATANEKAADKITPEIKINANLNIKKTGNGRIEVSRTNKSGNNEVFELPEYMYHITSSDNINSILQSGKLNRSLNEQLTGVFLIDSQNFLNHYQKVDISSGKSLDLVTGLFRQATKCRQKNSTLASQKVHIIKIPTAELIENGKLRVRCQEDFFKIQRQLLSLQKNSAQKINVRGMGDAANRDILKQNLISNGMKEADVDIFLKEIEEKLHQGYTLPKASANNLENSNAIEYIYNKDIDFSILKGIENKELSLADIVAVSKNKEVIDASKLATLLTNFNI